MTDSLAQQSPHRAGSRPFKPPVPAKSTAEEETTHNAIFVHLNPTGEALEQFALCPVFTRSDGTLCEVDVRRNDLEDAIDEGATYQTFERGVTSVLFCVAFDSKLCTRAYSQRKLGMYLSHSFSSKCSRGPSWTREGENVPQ